MFWQTSAGFAGVAVLRSGRVLHTGRSPDVLANVRQVRWRRRPSIGTRLTYGTVAEKKEPKRKNDVPTNKN